MRKLLLPLHHYDEAGRIKPPKFFWICGLLLAKSYFIFVVSMSNLKDSDMLLDFFYPDASEMYLGFIIGAGAVIAMLITAHREKWWSGRLAILGYLIKPLLMLTLMLDIGHQIQIAIEGNWQFSWVIGLFIMIDAVLFYWLIKSRHVRLMLADWKPH
ncbi:DUF2919 domain-containing protein [Aliiglaciecola sp. LCG003]|uniref:DUF2919 domain-containing protein n=1 Tax=Aliiglaciecola sp. LCG003 TaxID=3053655 RepID=UPI0025735729|nr:DUF2919 domain-containing protein [Aliiglaciecola sp. LCG003]WJG10955.1 DUF2919 domain-containing protein [Aliiglaciecola sp. LCG003]